MAGTEPQNCGDSAVSAKLDVLGEMGTNLSEYWGDGRELLIDTKDILTCFLIRFGKETDL